MLFLFDFLNSVNDAFFLKNVIEQFRTFASLYLLT